MNTQCDPFCSEHRLPPWKRVTATYGVPHMPSTLTQSLTRKLLLAVALLGLALPAAWAGDYDGYHRYRHSSPRLLASGLMGTIGATIGPDGALYVAEGAIGKITRINLRSGEMRTFAYGLPPAVIPIGGATDIAFIGRTAYVLVALVDFTGNGTGVPNGIYRIDDKDSFTVIADLGAYSLENPPVIDPAGSWDYFVATGVQYALQPYGDGLLVSDGHHNRVLHVAIDGDAGTITELKQFGNVVPTGLAATADRVYSAELGPLPHLPEDGRVVSFDPLDTAATRVVASGVSMIVDVEFGPQGTLYALSQGDKPDDPNFVAGDPAAPNTGRLLSIESDGTFTVLADGLDRPTSLDFACDIAVVVTLTGEVWKYETGRGTRCDEDYRHRYYDWRDSYRYHDYDGHYDYR
jgi:sugar lactone lactonase YvrE